MIQHRIKNVDGGNQIATTMYLNGKVYAKVTTVPTGKAKELNVSHAKVMKSVMLYHEQKIREEAAKSE